jgi:hypothetical protein
LVTVFGIASGFETTSKAAASYAYTERGINGKSPKLRDLERARLNSLDALHLRKSLPKKDRLNIISQPETMRNHKRPA